MNFGEPAWRVKFSGFMKNENAFGPAKNTTVSPRIRVFHTFPCCRVRFNVNRNGSFKNFRASPTNGAPSDPGGVWLMTDDRTTDRPIGIARVPTKLPAVTGPQALVHVVVAV